jgi:hypothetical protein
MRKSTNRIASSHSFSAANCLTISSIRCFVILPGANVQTAEDGSHDNSPMGYDLGLVRILLGITEERIYRCLSTKRSLLVDRAYDAVHRLFIELHYLSCNGVGRSSDESQAPEQGVTVQ